MRVNSITEPWQNLLTTSSNSCILYNNEIDCLIPLIGSNETRCALHSTGGAIVCGQSVDSRRNWTSRNGVHVPILCFMTAYHKCELSYVDCASSIMKAEQLSEDKNSSQRLHKTPFGGIFRPRMPVHRYSLPSCRYKQPGFRYWLTTLPEISTMWFYLYLYDTILSHHAWKSLDCSFARANVWFLFWYTRGSSGQHVFEVVRLFETTSGRISQLA